MISIIVPVYNAEKYLERCLTGLLDQSYKNTEIILIDDGSTDQSGRICDTFTEKYDKIRTVHVKNGGVSAARNRGMEEARGEYFTFVDADDIAEPDMLAGLLALLEETGCDVAGCGYYSFTDATGRNAGNAGAGAVGRAAKAGGKQSERLTGREFIAAGILAGDTRCWSKLYVKETVGKLRFDTGFTIGEDMLFLLELAKRGAVFGRTDYKGYGYYSNESGAMKQDFKDSYMDQITCWEKAAEEIRAIEPRLEPKAASIVMISVMLVAGKLAVMLTAKHKSDRAGRKKPGINGYMEECRRHLEESRRVKGAFRELPAGYKLKTTAYALCPRLYLTGYGLLQRIKGIKVGKE